MNYRQTPPANDQFGYAAVPAGWDMQSDGDSEGDFLDVRGLLLTFWRRKLVIVATVLAGLGLALLAINNTLPRYSAAATVIFQPERLQIVDMEQVVDEQASAGGGLQNQVEILRSSTLLGRVADRLGLAETPEFNPALREVPSPLVDRILERPSLSSLVQPYAERALENPDTPAWLQGFLSRFFETPTVESEDLPDPAQLPEDRRKAIVRSLNDNLALTTIPGSSVIQLRYSSTNPAMAAAIVNTIAELYISFQMDAKREDVAAVMEMMGRRVEELEDRLAESQEAVESARIALSEEQGQSVEMTTLQLDGLNETLAATRLERSALQARHDRADGALDAGQDLWVVTEFRESPAIAGFRRSELELLDEMTAVRAIAAESGGNPQQMVLQARLDQVRRNIREEARYIVAALEFEVESIAQRQRQLEGMVRELQIIAIEQTRSELLVQQLEREALANQTIYESFLARMKEISEQAELQTSDARVLSAADPPQSRDNSSRNRLVAVAGAGGLVIGLGLVLLLERLNTSFRSPAELEERTGVPLLAAIPQMGRRRSPKQLIAHLRSKPNGILAESIRNLRTSILFSDLEAAPKVVMFTSSVPEEGKSTTAMLMAVTSQQMGRSAVLVDCDLRRRTLAKLLTTEPGRPGLVTLLEGGCTLEEGLITEPASGLRVLAQSVDETIQSSPADILASKSFGDLIDQLRDQFDLVVLDTPPALAVTDSRLLARMSDAVVYLVRWNHTSKNAVREGLRELTSMKANITGTAFTLVSQSKAAKYSNNEYFYRQRYGSYLSS